MQIKSSIELGKNILLLKSRFFLVRALTYSSFLLFPIYIPKSVNLSPIWQCMIMLVYILFMCGQWFLLGKEIDHRLKIYYRVNSSLDRIIYRIFLGMIFVILYFNLINLLEPKWLYNSFWITWAALGLFYSWPTRGKIIQESVSTNFSEYRYLDSFEKTLVHLIVIFFIFSIPEFPVMTSFKGLQLFFDPFMKIDSHLWNFIKVNYYPFYSYPHLFRIGVSLHFYVIGAGLFLLVFYALLRYFVSRRLSLLGVFALISSWSFSKILESNYGSAMLTTFSLMSIWAFFWVVKSSTYRAGLFLGLISFYGMLINQTFVLIPIGQYLILYFMTLKDRTWWYKRQLIKYATFGWLLCIALLILNIEQFKNIHPNTWSFFDSVMKLIDRKAFFVLSFFGIIIILANYFKPRARFLLQLNLNRELTNYLFLLSIFFCFNSFIFDAYIFRDFSLMWLLCVLSLMPIELIFQTISRMRSNRNMIYFVYILICLLDSHFEGRVKIFLKLLD
jgi:hypothetical protein